MVGYKASLIGSGAFGSDKFSFSTSDITTALLKSLSLAHLSHGMHEMQTIVTDVPIVWHRSVMRLRCANMAEGLEVLFGVETRVVSRNRLDAAFARLLWPVVLTLNSCIVSM